MARKANDDTAKQLEKLRALLENFDRRLDQDDVRAQVLAVIPVLNAVRKLGVSLIPKSDAHSARDRILAYLRKYPRTIIDCEELMVVAGISEWARRVRELRVQFGWRILTGATLDVMKDAEELGSVDLDLAKLRPDQYILVSENEDRDAAYRWNAANSLRKQKIGMREKILAYLRMNVGKEITGEELMYVAGNKTEWARRVRELRTEFGWPITTQSNGRPDLPVGVYVLEADRQEPEHDRRITESTKRKALMRDGYICKLCGWTHALWSPSDPRHLELHHILEHAKGGGNEESNLVTLCNICHDDVHAGRAKIL